MGSMERYQFATVSEWMIHGNIMEYIRKHATNRLELVRVLSPGSTVSLQKFSNLDDS